MALSDLWHKTLAYFGMTDDDEDDYVDEPAAAPPRQGSSRAQDELEQSYRERPNVRRLGPRRRDDFDDIFAEDQAVGSGSRSTQLRAVEQVRQAPAMEVHLVVPKSFNDAQQIADKFKDSIPVILNLQGADTDLSKRLIDFASGLTYALNGGMQRVADKVFLLTPRNVEVSAEQRAQLLERGGFYNQA